MKKYIILLVGVFLIGSLAIFLPDFLSSYSDRKEAEKIEKQEKKHIESMEKISSTLDTIEEPEISNEEREPEIYDENQMYFEGIETLYDYFLFGQVEDIKQKIQFYVQNYIDNNLLDCKLIPESIKENNNIIEFNLEMKNVSEFSVKVTKDNEGKIIDITIFHSLK